MVGIRATTTITPKGLIRDRFVLAPSLPDLHPDDHRYRARCARKGCVMAYFVNSTTTAIDTNPGSTYTVTLGTHQDGDLLLVCLTQRFGNVDYSATGWTLIGTIGDYQSSRQGWIYKVVGTGEAPVANPAVACRAGESIIGMSLTIRKASLTPTIRWQRTDWGDFSTTKTATTNPPTASIETANAAVVAPANALLIYSIGSRSNPSFRVPLSDLMEVSYQAGSGSTDASQSVGYRQVDATGTVPSITFKSTIVAGGNAWVLSIPDDGDGVIDRNWFSGGTEFDYYGDYGEAHFPFGTEGVPNTLDNAQASPPATPSIDGVDLGGGTPSVSHTSLVLATNSPNGKCTSIRTDDTTASLWTGVVQTLNSNQNMSGKIFSVHYRLDRDSNAVFGDKGCCVAFADSAGDWIAYQLATNPAILSNPERTAFIELGGGDQLDADGGAVDWTDIDKIGWFIHRDGSGNNNTYLYIKNAQLLSTAVYTGGASARPLTIASAKPLTESWDFYKLQGLQASAQSEIRWPIQIGDGTFKTYFKASAASTETPTAHDVTTSTSQQDWNVSDDACGVTVYASANCTMDFSAALLTSATKQPFTIHASSSTSATYSFQGLTLVGWTVTWKTGIPATLIGVTFDSCYEIDMNGQDMTSCTVDNTANSAAGKAALTFTENGAVLDSCTIDGTGAAYAIELGTSVTAITLTDCTITAGSTDKVHVLKTTGTVTITISGTTSLAAGDVTSAGATVVISGPTVNQVVIVSGFTAGSRIQIYDTTNSIELFNGTASAGDTVVSGTTATWTDPTAAAGNRAIRVRVAYVSGATAKMWQQNTGLTCGTSSTTNSITYPITQTADTTYDSNAVDGSGVTGITFTDAATDLVNINIAADTTPLKDIYAAFVYWLFTAAGIADDVAYIDAPDPANYIMTSMKFRNTSTDPLKITGGYFYDSTGSVENCVDVAGSSGNIYPMPAHVVPYQTTGTYAITGDLQDALDAIAGVPADVIAVAVDGSTTLAESLRLANAVLGGKVSGASTGTESFRDLADTKNRVVATVDSSGNRTAITRDLT